MSHPPPRRSPWLVTAAVDGQTVVYDPVRDGFHVLNHTATAVWELIDGRRPVADIARLISERYVAAPHREIHDLIGTFRTSGLVLTAPHEPSSSARGRQPRPRAGTGNGVAPHHGDRAEGAARRRDSVGAGPDVTTYRALDYVFSVDGDDPQVVAAAREALRDLRSERAETPSARYWLRTVADTVVIEANGAAVTLPTVPDRATHLLLWHVNQGAVRKSLPWNVILHAAAVERDGAVVLLPGGMERGKTTTAAGLVRAGYRYLSDELAAIDPRSLHIHPYPKPLGIDPGAQHVLDDLRPRNGTIGEAGWIVPATAIRPDAVANAGRPLVVVAPEYDPDASTQLEPLSAADMVVRLADCTFGFKDRPQRNLAVLARLAESCACYRLAVSSLDTAVLLIDAAADAAMRSRPDWMSARGT